MRVKLGRALANETKKIKANNKFRTKRGQISNKNGRIKVKDMGNSSYMEMGFYKKFPLPSINYRIIDLAEIEI